MWSAISCQSDYCNIENKRNFQIHIKGGETREGK